MGPLRIEDGPATTRAVCSPFYPIQLSSSNNKSAHTQFLMTRTIDILLRLLRPMPSSNTGRVLIHPPDLHSHACKELADINHNYLIPAQHVSRSCLPRSYAVRKLRLKLMLTIVSGSRVSNLRYISFTRQATSPLSRLQFLTLPPLTPFTTSLSHSPSISSNHAYINNHHPSS